MARAAVLSFVCQNCGAAYNKWQGKCESCNEWNSLSDEDAVAATSVPISIMFKISRPTESSGRKCR